MTVWSNWPCPPNMKQIAYVPQSQRCGFVAKSITKLDSRATALVGGTLGDNGKESIRALFYNDALHTQLFHVNFSSNTIRVQVELRLFCSW